LATAGEDFDVRTMDGSTRTADEAAAAVGVEVGQIVKSLVWAVDGEPVLALVAGDRRLDTGRLAAALDVDAVDRADADAVRAATGFAIGGVPPFGHTTQLRTVMDASLRRFDEVWAAAGTPRDVFAIAPDELARRSRATVAELAVT
jgi:Cys-tRNA(Pro) deacylase